MLVLPYKIQERCFVCSHTLNVKQKTEPACCWKARMQKAVRHEQHCQKQGYRQDISVLTMRGLD